MAWKYKNIKLKVGKGWVDYLGYTHPYNWVNWSAEDKKKWEVIWEEEA